MPSEKLELIPQIRLFAGDKEKLENYFPRLGYNAAIRSLVRRAILEIEKELEAQCPTDKLPAPHLELDQFENLKDK